MEFMFFTGNAPALSVICGDRFGHQTFLQFENQKHRMAFTPCFLP